MTLALAERSTRVLSHICSRLCATCSFACSLPPLCSLALSLCGCLVLLITTCSRSRHSPNLGLPFFSPSVLPLLPLSTSVLSLFSFPFLQCLAVSGSCLGSTSVSRSVSDSWGTLAEMPPPGSLRSAAVCIQILRDSYCTDVHTN